MRSRHRSEVLSEGTPGSPTGNNMEALEVEPAQAGALFAAAAECFRRAPWRNLAIETAIRVEGPDVPDDPRFGVVMGQEGMVRGLAIYDRIDDLRRIWNGSASDAETAVQSAALCLTFGDESELAPDDLEAIRSHGWPIARPDAYPMLLRVDPMLNVRPPTPAEMRLTEICLRAVPEFVERHPLGDTEREPMSVPAFGGEAYVTLSWVDHAAVG